MGFANLDVGEFGMCDVEEEIAFLWNDHGGDGEGESAVFLDPGVSKFHAAGGGRGSAPGFGQGGKGELTDAVGGDGDFDEGKGLCARFRSGEVDEKFESGEGTAFGEVNDGASR